MKIGTLKLYFRERVNGFFPSVHVHCPVWVRFCLSDLQIMVLVIFGFRENRLTDAHEITFMRAP